MVSTLQAADALLEWPPFLTPIRLIKAAMKTATDRTSKMDTASSSGKRMLRLPALAFTQRDERTLYALTAPGGELSSFITVSRLKRDPDGDGLSGYQRPQVLSHIAEIREYLESDAAMLPNALVVAFDERVRFEPLAAESAPGGDVATHGELAIPLADGQSDHRKPGWVVDGQQRMSALRHAEVDDFQVCLVGFIAKSVREQREQFMLVNATKPLPKSLIYEMLPQTDCRLPDVLAGRQVPAQILERLNYDEDSPMRLNIKTHTNPDGQIKDNSVLQMIENSLENGVLYRYRDRRSGNFDIDAMAGVLKAFWSVVADIFRYAWSLPPTQSRLTHGAGIVSMGYVMDAIADRHRHAAWQPTEEHFAGDLAQLAPACHWTKGSWEIGDGHRRRWDEIQNTSQDRRLLTNHLMIQYRKRVAS